MLYWLASYPKSGNTWCRAFLTNLFYGDADINALIAPDTAINRDCFDSFIDVPSSDLNPDEIGILRRSVYRGLAEGASAPLPLKLHCAFTLAADGLPIFPRDATAGVVLIIRNPLDIVVSLAHFLGRGIDDTIGFMAMESSILGPQDRAGGPALPELLGSWSSHTLSWLDHSEMPVLMLRYEDLIADPVTHFTRLADFMPIGPQIRPIGEAVHLSRFAALRQQEQERGFRMRPASATQFFRSGQADVWRHVLTPAQSAEIIRNHGPVMRRLGYL